MNFIFDSIRGRLVAGLLAVVALLIVAGSVGRAGIGGLSRDLDAALGQVRRESALTAQLTSSITLELAAAQRYLERGLAADLETFRTSGWAAHDAQRALSGEAGLSANEVALLATIDDRLSGIETGLAAAHRLRDLGRLDEARARAGAVRDEEAELTAEIERLAALRTRALDRASAELRDDAARRQRLLVFVVLGAIALGIAVVVSTVQSITGPLGHLVVHARALSRGELNARTVRHLPGEFRELAEALNGSAERLADVVGVANATAEDVATSAHQLTSAAEQVSLAATQTATAMSEVTEGAEVQVSGLREADTALAGVRQRALEVRAGAEEVNDLAAEIERLSREKRAEITRAQGLLGEIRQAVDHAALEVRELTATAERINGFVGIVSRIAEQTNLLSLNAAIEAARAGAAGRGFAVVADEVRKLADQAQAAAEDVIQLTAVVSRRVNTTTEAMETGATRVGEIERVSEGLDGALGSIGTAAERARAAAAGLGDTADENSRAVSEAAAGITAAARAAEGHAAAAQQVSASTQEQSAACEEMSGAANALLRGSVRLREIVGNLKVG